MKGTTWTVRAVGWSSAPEVGEQMLAHQLTTVMVRNVHNRICAAESAVFLLA